MGERRNDGKQGRIVLVTDSIWIKLPLRIFVNGLPFLYSSLR